MGVKARCQEKKGNEVNRENELFFVIEAKKFPCAIGELNRTKRSVLTILILLLLHRNVIDTAIIIIIIIITISPRTSDIAIEDTKNQT